jgi:uncharacterized membrane protein
MAIEKNDNPPGRQDARGQARWLVWVRLLLGIAILGAGYLAWVAIHNGPVAGCGPGSGCDKVLQSRWAYWLEVPVSVPAVLVYLALLVSTILLERRPLPDDQRGAWAAVIGLSVIVAGAAIWFVGLQMFVIEAFCKFCLTAHACGLAAAVLCLKNIPLAANPDMPMWASGLNEPGVPRKAMRSIVATGLAGVFVLVSGQMLVQKKRNVVREFVRPATNTLNIAAMPTAGKTNASGLTGPPTNQLVSPNLKIVGPHLLSLYNSKFLLQLDDVPMMGSPDASNVIVNLFDYNCTHCRLLHPILKETQRRLGNNLAIVSLPMPMCTNCNPFVPANHPTFTNSCDYARLSLAVWRANRFVFPEFEDWLFSTSQPAPVEEVKEYAIKLVGSENLQLALTNEWIQQQILTACYLHHTNWQLTGGAAMPQVIMGEVISVGPLNSVNHLLVLLEKYLGIQIKR